MLIVEQLRASLEYWPESVGLKNADFAFGSEEAEACLRRTSYDVVIMDVEIPSTPDNSPNFFEGLALLLTIQAKGVCVIVLTWESDPNKLGTLARTGVTVLRRDLAGLRKLQELLISYLQD